MVKDQTPMKKRKNFDLKNSRKKEARKPHELAKKAKKLTGLKAKIYNKQRYFFIILDLKKKLQ